MGQYRPDTEADVLLYRDGELERLQVILGSSPTNTVASAEPEVVRERGNPLGFRVSELSAETRQVTGLNGVRIAELDDGPGREAGLLVGDVVISLNRQEVASPEQFAAIASNLPESGFVPIRIVREGQSTTLPLKLAP